ncbi:hypothetical protein [Candidatus Protofrankia californiensis]|uniref:hypothetical protein n=1 Tax=Candidatus Protofrankia californiensis TaxID=1839754 RepID=UPI001041A5FD|nr:hypothetical protein [Candidatus Protofrankia californiensis]
MTTPAETRRVETTETEETEAQRRMVLTAHPLQRVGAFALTALAGCREPGDVTADAFDAAVRRMADDAVRAAVLPSTTAEGAFWLKASGSFFPNSKMNHPSRASRGRQEIIDQVVAWRTVPDRNRWPGRSCVLCGRDAVGYFAKVDVPLAESENTRNSTPRGHASLALCWPCVCCFHALPYGCRLTGGQSSAVHSWDDRFLAKITTEQVDRNDQHITLGKPVSKSGGYAAEVEALERLRCYEDDVHEGIELFVFTNYNVPSPDPLHIHGMEQPLAEWLRRNLARTNDLRAMEAAYTRPKMPGRPLLARDAFHGPKRILHVLTSFVGEHSVATLDEPHRRLIQLCFSFATEVMGMNDEDVKSIRRLARNVATVVGSEPTASALKKYQVAHRQSGKLRSWLEREAVAWTLKPPTPDAGPMVSTAQFRLLFDRDGQGWDYQRLLLIAVLEELDNRGWRPVDGAAVAQEIKDSDETAFADHDENESAGINR